MTQIAASFILLAGASALITTLIALQSARTDVDTRHVLAIHVPVMSYGKTPQQVLDFYEESIRRVDALPGVEKTAFGLVVPWHDASPRVGLQFSADGHGHAAGEEDPRAQWRVISPGFFAALGVPILTGRDFNDLDGRTQDNDPVVIISQTLAQRMFPNRDVVNRHLSLTFPTNPIPQPYRIVGVAADVDDMHVNPQPGLTIYPIGASNRLFVRAAGDPHALVPEVTRIIREIAANQAVERAATLEDIRAEMLSPERLNAFVFSGFAGIALLIAVVGVAGVLAFSVSARTREFGIRLAVGSQPHSILTGVLGEGLWMTALGLVAGALGGYALARVVGSYIQNVQLPGVVPIAGSAAVLLIAAIIGSLLPAARAARVDVVQALRAE